MKPGVFRCPVCQGRIAMWALRSTVFTCHHCRWVLTSNILVVRLRALLAAAGLELLLLLGVWLWLGDISRALGLWAALGSVLGVGVWYLTVHTLLVIAPVRPQAPDAAR